MARTPAPSAELAESRCPHCGEQHSSSYSHCPRTGKPLLSGQAFIGRTIAGKYRILGLLGEGGMGAVYIAEHQLIGRKVAIKRLHPELASDERAVARFQREARAAGATGHEHIVEILDLGYTEDEAPFLVMEYLRGASLAQVLKQETRISPRRAVFIVGQLLGALSAVHAKEIVHRDLKPDNIFLTRVGGTADYVKVLDFGISKMRSEEGEGFDLTRTGATMGTPYYMSPEQARGVKRLDHRVDLYAAGVILYEAMTGRTPYVGDNYHALLQQILRHEPTRPSTLVDDLPPGLEAVLMRAMAKDPADRFPSATTMLHALVPFGAVVEGEDLPELELPPIARTANVLATSLAVTTARAANAPGFGGASAPSAPSAASAPNAMAPNLAGPSQPPPSLAPLPSAAPPIPAAPPPTGPAALTLTYVPNAPPPSASLPIGPSAAPQRDAVREAPSAPRDLRDLTRDAAREPGSRDASPPSTYGALAHLSSSFTTTAPALVPGPPRIETPSQDDRSSDARADLFRTNPRISPTPGPLVRPRTPTAVRAHRPTPASFGRQSRAAEPLGPRYFLATSDDWVGDIPRRAPVYTAPPPDEGKRLSTPKALERGATPQEVTEGGVKSSMAAAALEHVDVTYGAGSRDRVLALLDADQREELRGVLLPMSWLPQGLYDALLRSCERLLGSGDGSVSAAIGRTLADRELPSTHRLFVQTATVPGAIERIGHFFRLYIHGAETRVLEGTAGSLRIEIETPVPETYYSLMVLSGFLQRLFEQSGAKEVRASVMSSRAKGDDRSSIQVRFRQS